MKIASREKRGRKNRKIARRRQVRCGNLVAKLFIQKLLYRRHCVPVVVIQNFSQNDLKLNMKVRKMKTRMGYFGIPVSFVNNTRI